MKHIKAILAAAFLAIGANINAELITDSSYGSIEESVNYTYYTGEEYVFDWFYATSYAFDAWYDTDTGEGRYSWQVWGPAGTIGVEMEAVGGFFYLTSYHGEGFMPSWSQAFWWQVYGM